MNAADKIFAQIETIPEGTKIPKPDANPYIVNHWGLSQSGGFVRKHKAMFYKMSKCNTKLKSIPLPVFAWACKALVDTGQLSRPEYERKFELLNSSAPCTYTTLGGVFVLLGEAVYEGNGIYRRKRK